MKRPASPPGSTPAPPESLAPGYYPLPGTGGELPRHAPCTVLRWSDRAGGRRGPPAGPAEITPGRLGSPAGGRGGLPGSSAKGTCGRAAPAIQVRFSRPRGTVQPIPVERRETQIVQPCMTLDEFLPGFGLPRVHWPDIDFDGRVIRWRTRPELTGCGCRHRIDVAPATRASRAADSITEGFRGHQESTLPFASKLSTRVGPSHSDSADDIDFDSIQLMKKRCGSCSGMTRKGGTESRLRIQSGRRHRRIRATAPRDVETA